MKPTFILKGQELYKKKWQIEVSLASATTFNEIRDIKIEF